MIDWSKKPEKPRPQYWQEKPHEKRQNKVLDKSVGGSLTPASGALDGAKGDRELDGNLKIEQKATDKKSISIKFDWLEKIYREARQQGKEPALIFSYLKIKSIAPTDWAVMPVSLFKRMYDFCKDNDFDF